jgi:hypothetical protein
MTNFLSFNASKDKAIEVLTRTWLIGTLFKVDKKTYASALYEFTYLLLWSVVPFFLGTLILYVSLDAPQKDFLQLSASTFKNGELLVFTISMLAPILYLTLHDPEQASPFPHKLPISTVVALVVVVCAVLFAILKASAVKDMDFVFDLSIYLTVLALTFRYLALVYHRYRMPSLSESDLRAPQQDFVANARAKLGGNQ